MYERSSEQILSQRAKDLAKPVIRHNQSHENSGKINLLVFHLGPESYAIDANSVLEIVPTDKMTSLPSLPIYIVGVLPVRGMIWSVMDLRLFFNIHRRGLSDYPRAILVETQNLRFGILADSTLDIVTLDSLNPPPEITEKIPRNMVRGTFNELTIVLDLEVLAQDPRMIIQDDIDS